MNVNEMTKILHTVDEVLANNGLIHCEKITKEIIKEFGYLGDCIWKSPDVIKNAKEREQNIIDELVIENRIDIASLRYFEESEKLNYTFPKLIATGNLFSLLSLFESYIYRLAFLIHDKKNKNTDIKKYLGKGVSNLLNYIEKYVPQTKKINLYSQIEASIKIRNCLVHAHGFIDWLKDERSREELQRIILSKQYLTDTHKKSSTRSSVNILDCSVGKQVQINNDYVFTLSTYARNFLLELCLNIEKTFS